MIFWFFLCFAAKPCRDNTVLCYHLLHELAHELAPVTPWFCGFALCCFFVCFVWWVCFWLGQFPVLSSKHVRSLMHRYHHAQMRSTIFQLMKTIDKSTSVPESTANPGSSPTSRFGRNAHQASTLVQYRELLKSMMIGKALLSGL